jgi:hypothetical protein
MAAAVFLRRSPPSDMLCMMHRSTRLLCLLLAVATRLGAQHDGHAEHARDARHRDSVSAMATTLLTHVAPSLAGRARSEALFTQPMLVLRGVRRGGALRYAVMLNAEQWTMPDGEPVAGIWGEGFIDRRHPHTVLHEVMLTGMRQVGRGSVSLSGGRGIVPFGTDDPMVRPFTKYPANHHHAQVLERIQLVAAIRPLPQVGLEASTFNGDEPASPTAAPRWRRFGDSKAARVTLWPAHGLELQGSVASLRSPEFVGGEGLDQRKWSASARWTPRVGAVRYVLTEWARTDDRYRERTLAGYGTALVEALAELRRVTVAIRAEQTSRHEEERLLDPFRTSRPPSDLTIKGITRWRLVTGQVAAAIPPVRALHGSVFLETTYARSAPQLRPALLDPADVIGGRASWYLSGGLRLGLGAMPVRVGRYGAAAGGPTTDAPLAMRHR